MLQLTRCEGSDCDFFLSPIGVLTRSSSCNPSACVGRLLLASLSIIGLAKNVFSGMSGIKTL